MRRPASPVPGSAPLAFDFAAHLASVRARMRRAVVGQHETDALYGWLRYHLGWADALGRACEAPRGKGVRPFVCLTACEAVGGAVEAAVDVAAAVELTHEFSLIHDDIEDGDALRRGRPALWQVAGPAQAINAGDALFSQARSVLSAAALDPAVALDAIRRYDAACIGLAEGQFMDLSFEDLPHVPASDYLSMVRRKTGALLGLAGALGALSGGATSKVADGFQAFGEALGVAFQIQDDILGLWGDPDLTGKPAGSDLVRGKKSMPILLALDDPALGTTLKDYLAAPDRDADRAHALVTAIEAAGHRARAQAEAEDWASRAREALDGFDLVANPAATLASLTRAAVSRAR